MKHMVTLYPADIKEAVRTYIEENFSGYTVADMRVNLLPTTGTERASATIEVDLGRPTQGKD